MMKHFAITATDRKRGMPGLYRDRGGSVAVEFVILIPVISILLLAAVDMGNIIYSRFRLTSAVAAGAAMVTARATEVPSERADVLARGVANLVANANGTGWAAARVVINNGVEAEKTGTEDVDIDNDERDSDRPNLLCYCPTSNASFGASQNCGTNCSGGGIAGRWVRISAQREFTPVFAGYGMVPDDGYITVVTMVQTE